MLVKIFNLLKFKPQSVQLLRETATDAIHGTIPPKPERTSFGLVKVCIAVIPGILIGALMSKGMANFLEENELFVPDDEDDDDD